MRLLPTITTNSQPKYNTTTPRQRIRTLEKERDRLNNELNRANNSAYCTGRGFDGVVLIDNEIQTLDLTAQ
jgi:hypothetical protein